MRILFQTRANLFTVFGGDTVQLLKTKEYLQRMGINVDISTELSPDLSKYDIVHIFNLMRGQETWLQVRNAKKQNKMVALSTIYGLYTEYERKARGGMFQILANCMTKFQIEYCKIFARALKNKEFHKGSLVVFLYGYKNTLKKICNNTDVFLPNSDSEMQRVIKDFSLKNCKYVTIPNAVDLDVFDYEKTAIASEYQYLENCVLCVARIDGRKNQLNVVRALNNAPYKVVFIGKPAPNHIQYYEQMKKEAAENIIFIPHIEHNQLPVFYKLAKVHILASWMETPGLSSLEAAVMKTNIVVTKKGDTYDYFGDYAFYCEPDDVLSIRKQTDIAYSSPFNDAFREIIIKKFNWQETARLTLNAYRSIYEA